MILLGIFSLHYIYSMYVGGDAWEWFGGANRFVAPAMPLFFITLAQAVHALRTTIRKRRQLDFQHYTRAELAALLILFLLFNTGSDNMLLYATLVKPVETHGQNGAQVRLAQSLNRHTTPQATIGIVQAGVAPYFSPQLKYVDLLGKSERVIARSQAHTCTGCGPLQAYLAFWPGHMKWDYNYVVTKLRPDMFGQVWPDSELVHLKSHYHRYSSKDGATYYVNKRNTNLNL